MIEVKEMPEPDVCQLAQTKKCSNLTKYLGIVESDSDWDPSQYVNIDTTRAMFKLPVRWRHKYEMPM